MSPESVCMGQARTQPAFDAAALSSLACVPQLHLALWRAGRNCNRVKPGQQRAKTSRGKQSQNTGFCSMNSLGWPGCWETRPDSRQQVRVDLEVRQGGRRGCLHRLTCVLRHSCPGSPAGGGGLLAGEALCPGHTRCLPLAGRWVSGSNVN